MSIDAEGIYKVVVYLPEEFLEKAMEAVNGTVSSIFPGYDRTFSYFPVTGTWRSLEGSNPYAGEVGEVSTETEMRLEFAVFGRDLPVALRAIREVHPYEAPAIDVMPMLSGLRLLGE